MSFFDQNLINSSYIQILSFSYPRHPSNSSSSSSLYSHSSCKFTCLQQTYIDYCNIIIHYSLPTSGISKTNLNKLQRIQNSLARVISNTSKYQHVHATPIILYLPFFSMLRYRGSFTLNCLFSNFTRMIKDLICDMDDGSYSS